MKRWRADSWHLIDPLGTVHFIENLTNFVEDNHHLFDAFALEFIGGSINRKYRRRRAAVMLGRLHPQQKVPLDSWRDWRWADPAPALDRKQKGAAAIAAEHAKQWSLSAPNGMQFHFTNLSQFVRDHADLFDPADLKPYERALGRTQPCRAVIGLGALRKREGAHKSWKGWRWAEQI